MVVTRETEPDARTNDRRLQTLLRASGADAERELERLLAAEVRPVVESVLARYARLRTPMYVEDGEDVAATVNVRVMEKLRAWRDDPSEPIENFRSYVARLAYNVVNDFLRKRHPERARLKNRLRYVLLHDSRFAMWNTDAGPAGGLASMSGGDPLEQVPDAVTPDAEESAAFALERIFTAARRPVLVDALADFFGDDARAAVSIELPDEIADDTPDAAAQALDRDFARALWEEIRQLRPMQRKALLLNLRYGGELDVLAVLMLSGIARFADLAAALEMSEETLGALWKELPLDDLRIAGLLGITRQQVINLRKSARDRLSRRLPR